MPQKGSSDCSVCRTRRPGRGQPVLFHAARPPQLSRAGYHSGHPRWAAAARVDGREAARALTSAACLARSADRARLCLIQIRISKTYLCRARRGPDFVRTVLARSPLHQPHCGTGIRPDRDIAARRSDIKTSRRLYRRGRQAIRANPRRKPGSRPSKAAAEERRTVCWREMDSNFRFRARRNQEISVSRWSSTDLVYGTVARISAQPSGRHAREQYRADKCPVDGEGPSREALDDAQKAPDRDKGREAADNEADGEHQPAVRIEAGVS